MALSVLAAFWAVSILFIITPGVDWAYAISAGIRGSVVVPAVAGMLFGHLMATLIVAAGVGTLLAGSQMALVVLTTLGAGYLLWLGVQMLLHPAQPLASATGESASWPRWMLKGACVSGLNPKVFLLFLALLPQFTDPSAAWPVPTQILALGLIHLFSCGVVYLLVGFGSQAVLQARPVVAQRVSRISGATMMVTAILLFVEQIFY